MTIVRALGQRSEPEGRRRARRGRKDLWPASLVAHVALLLGAAAVVAIVVGALLWLSVGRPGLVAGGPLDAKDRFEGIKLVLAVVGGIGAVVALTIAYRKQRHSESAEHREDVKLFTSRFGEAAQQLGSEHAATRLAGVYAMARTADDALDFEGRQLCIEVLCGYLRLPYEPDERQPGFRGGESAVRESVIRVIRDHLRPDFSEESWCGHNFRLGGAVFDGLDFTGIRLTGGHMNFHKARFVAGTVYFTADLDGGNLWFTGTRFDGADVRFGGARFAAGRVSFKGAIFAAGRVDFDGLELHDATAKVEFEDAHYEGANIAWGPFPPAVV